MVNKQFHMTHLFGRDAPQETTIWNKAIDRHGWSVSFDAALWPE
jgi:hypothetical protein